MQATDRASSTVERILLVDCDADARAFYARCLQSVASHIDEAEVGREALVKTVLNRPGLIVTDTRLSGFSGYDLCDALRRHTATSNIAIVVITSDVQPAGLAHARDVGADAVLSKPCSPSLLMREVRRLINRSVELRRDAQSIRSRAHQQIAKSDQLQMRANLQGRRALSRTFVRFGTSQPPTEPPELVCPACAQALMYERSHVGGVSEKQLEQWDYFECESGCGSFQYRHRTRRLRRLS
jgi:chemotaxis family two-component system response regulator PixH